ncbi:hypothetical protein LGL97_14305 [Pectobacterium brasiliense]|uniref:hypothetical protein n=1 Tax=Pectobacterium brasiliense TaxID=180957 RepID=UPI001CE106EB|nr:hypothetical protein [Pectobacterium brasiliense]MCA5919584.1 hypothetical protein [Pectobacterium brasiliense]MCA5939654.1 hypothetical protein [Pectobacterium brasiliense]MCA5942715.1 hypothetical protein [Pectobacterium brasiliense]UCP88932.1 hypothetical protein LGL97_14305 [Pectobacterium brasiliense]
MTTTVPTKMTLPAEREVQAAVQLKHPALGVDHYLEILFRQGLVQTTKALATCRVIPNLKNHRVVRNSR